MGKLLNLFLLVLLVLFFTGLFLGIYKALNFLDVNKPLASDTEQIIDNENELTTENSAEAIWETDPEEEEIDLDRLDEILADDEDEAFGLDEPLISTDSLSSGQGTAQKPELVIVSEEPDPSPSTSSPKSYQAKGSFYIIAGSFKNQANANTELKTLKKLGYSNARVINFAGSAYSTVILDNFVSRTKANQVARDLKAKYKKEAYVRQRKSNR